MRFRPSKRAASLLLPSARSSARASTRRSMRSRVPSSGFRSHVRPAGRAEHGQVGAGDRAPVQRVTRARSPRAARPGCPANRARAGAACASGSMPTPCARARARCDRSRARAATAGRRCARAAAAPQARAKHRAARARARLRHELLGVAAAAGDHARAARVAVGAVERLRAAVAQRLRQHALHRQRQRWQVAQQQRAVGGDAQEAGSRHTGAHAAEQGRGAVLGRHGRALRTTNGCGARPDCSCASAPTAQPATRVQTRARSARRCCPPRARLRPASGASARCTRAPAPARARQRPGAQRAYLVLRRDSSPSARRTRPRSASLYQTRQRRASLRARLPRKARREIPIRWRPKACSASSSSRVKLVRRARRAA